MNNLFKIGPAITLFIFSMLIIDYQILNWFEMNSQQSITVTIESGIQNGTVGIFDGNNILNPESG
tara:strand:+ start:1384 stop:1578 length:195 start_codon:yes stop_codon:yes gene_type:complete